MEQCSLMKPKCLLFLFLLGFGRLSPTVSSIDESNVASYEVVRRSNAGDLFYVNTINVSQCQLSGWCSKFGPAYSAGGTNCGCTCNSDVSSFLPSLRRCLKGNQLLENLEGCPKGTYQNLFGTANNPVFKFAVNLTRRIIKKTSAKGNQLNCSLYGYFFDYGGFHASWKHVLEGIFKVNKKGGAFNIKMKDKSNKLSGRVIKLNLMCTNKTQKGQPVLQACYLFKAVGHVTYYAPARTSTVHTFRTSVGYHTSSSLTHPSSPSPQLPQSTQITSMSSLSHSASLPSPSPSLDVMTRIPTTLTEKFSHMGTRSLETRPALRTSRSILPLTLNTEVESLLSVSSEDVSNQVIYTGIHTSSVTTGEPNYSEPSELLTTEASLPPVDGPGDKEAKKSGKDKGVAIGGGVGGAVAFGIIVIGLITVFCRRRKLRESMEKKEKLFVEGGHYPLLLEVDADEKEKMFMIISSLEHFII